MLWCGTDFLLIDFDDVWERHGSDGTESKAIRYMCVGQEIAPTTKRKHQQFWLQFYNQQRMTKVKSIVGPEIHLEVCRGSIDKNDKYCQKDGDYKEYGQKTYAGKREDLDSVKEAIDEGKSMYEIADSHFIAFVKYHRGFEKYKFMHDSKRAKKWREVTCELITGPTGCGKTRVFYEYEDCYLIHGDDLQWWDGYSGEANLLIDEYSNQVKITKLLGLLDGHCKRLATKGGHTFALWTHVILTSNLRKSEIHAKAKKSHRDALWRRCKTVRSLWTEATPPPENPFIFLEE